MPVSHQVEQYLDSFWRYLSYVASTLIFLMVGLLTRPELLFRGLDVAVIVIAGMLLSRAVVIYGLMPAAGQLRHHPRRVVLSYHHILNWGGLRGAVTLALAMGLSTLPGAEGLLPVTLVAVLFTIIVQGLTIGTLTHRLHLDVPEAPERIAEAESWLLAKSRARNQLLELKNTPFARTGLPGVYANHLDAEMSELRRKMRHWRSQEEGPVGEWQRCLVRGLSLEISYCYRMFDQGLLPSHIYMLLRKRLNGQIEALRHGYPAPEFDLMARLPGIWNRLRRNLRLFTTPMLVQVADDYLLAWMRRLSSHGARHTLESIMDLDHTDTAVRDDVLRIYFGWHEEAKRLIEQIEERYPEVAIQQQRLLVQRLVETAQIQDIEQQERTGLLTEGHAERMIGQIRQFPARRE